MLQLQQQKQQITLATQQEQLAQFIQYTDDKINKLVYELYGLGEEDARVVEGINLNYSAYFSLHLFFVFFKMTSPQEII